MNTKWAMVLVAFLVAMAGCGLGGDTNDGLAASSVDGGPTGDESGSSDEGAAGDTGSGASQGGSAGSDAPVASGETTCTLTADGVGFELFLHNDSGEPTSYFADIEVLDAGTIVNTAEASVINVLPGEVVREYFYTGLAAEISKTDCRVADLRPTVESELGSLGADEVESCQNLRESEFGNFSYDLTVTNSSPYLAKKYAVRSAIRNPAGERISTRILVVKGADDGFESLDPGEAWTTTDNTLGAPYDPTSTCEIISIEVYTDDEFFSSDSGATAGSLSSDVGFATGSADLTEDAEVLLRGTLERLARHDGPICIEGYADSVGDDADNLALSTARAESVADYLTESGGLNDIEAIGYGETAAPTDDLDDPGLRRVDITLAACGG